LQCASVIVAQTPPFVDEWGLDRAERVPRHVSELQISIDALGQEVAHVIFNALHGDELVALHGCGRRTPLLLTLGHGRRAGTGVRARKRLLGERVLTVFDVYRAYAVVASEVFVQRSGVLGFDAFAYGVPTTWHIGFGACEFEVIHVHDEQEPPCRVPKAAAPFRDWLEAN
jgi:hypothetical protein